MKKLSKESLLTVSGGAFVINWGSGLGTATRTGPMGGVSPQ